MARTYKDLTDHAVDRVTGGAEEDYARGHARRVRHMEAGGKLVRRIGKWEQPARLCRAGVRLVRGEPPPCRRQGRTGRRAEDGGLA